MMELDSLCAFDVIFSAAFLAEFNRRLPARTHFAPVRSQITPNNGLAIGTFPAVAPVARWGFLSELLPSRKHRFTSAKIPGPCFGGGAEFALCRWGLACDSNPGT